MALNSGRKYQKQNNKSIQEKLENNKDAHKKLEEVVTLIQTKLDKLEKKKPAFTKKSLLKDVATNKDVNKLEETLKKLEKTEDNLTTRIDKLGPKQVSYSELQAWKKERAYWADRFRERWKSPCSEMRNFTPRAE